MMIMEIKEPVTKEKILEALELSNTNKEKNNLKKHFGKLKRGFDGLEY
jgi:hypothetical protein